MAQEGHAEWGGVGAEIVRGGDRGRDPCFLALAQVGIGTSISVCDGKAVEAAAHDEVEFTGRIVVPEKVASVVGCKEFVAARSPIEADGVA